MFEELRNYTALASQTHKEMRAVGVLRKSLKYHVDGLCMEINRWIENHQDVDVKDWDIIVHDDHAIVTFKGMGDVPGPAKSK